MNIVICGAGHVGTHAAEVLAPAGHNITVIDQVTERLHYIADTLDVGTLWGNCANADVLVRANVADADALVAATNEDEINILTASVGKALGARRSVARVHHSAYFDQRGLNYQKQFDIDRLICPEHATARTIACTLRNPGAMAIENFGRGTLEIQEFEVSDDAEAIGKPLDEVKFPTGTRLAAVTRSHHAFIPEATTVIQPDDVIVLVGHTDVYQQARKLFHKAGPGRQRVAIMGGSSTGVWLARALHRPGFSLRLFVQERGRAEELAGKLDWATVLQADPTDPSVFSEEQLGDADAFVSATDDDEQNIIGSAWAKSMGVKEVVAVVQRRTYLHLLGQVGIDHAFSPRVVAVRQIESVVDDRAVHRETTLAEGVVDIYRVRVGRDAEVIGRPLRHIKLTPRGVIAAVQKPDRVFVPGADDVLHAGDALLVIGQHGMEATLQKLFAAG